MLAGVEDVLVASLIDGFYAVVQKRRARKLPVHPFALLDTIKALAKLDPYAAAARESETRAMEARAGKKAGLLAAKRTAAKKERKQFKAQGHAFYAKVSAQGDVCADGDFGV